MKYSLRSLMVVVTLVAVVLGGVCGFWRLSQHIIFEAEHEYWTQQVREGRVRNPHDSPAATFLTPKQIDALVEEANKTGKKP